MSDTAPIDAAAENANAASGTVTPTPSPAVIASPTITTATAIVPTRVPCISAIGPMPIVNSHIALEQLANQLHVLTTPLPTIQSQLTLTQLEDTVHTQLQRMDEFAELIDTIKFETNQMDTQLLPMIQAKQAGLNSLYQQVHTFDKYVKELDRYVSYVESRTDQVDTILKRTAVMEVEYARNRDSISASRSGVNSDLAQAEKAVNKLWTSLKSLGSKSPSPNVSSPPISAAALQAGAPTILDLVDAWVPFEPPTDINEFFNLPPEANSAVDAKSSE